MSTQYDYAYGRWGVPDSIANGPQIMINPDKSGYYNAWAAGAQQFGVGALSWSDHGISAINRYNVGFGNLSSWGGLNSSFFGYDIGSSLYQLATGKKGTMGNVISGVVGGGAGAALNSYLQDYKKDGSIASSLGLKDASLRGIAGGVGLLGLGLTAATSIISMAGIQRKINTQYRRAANYMDSESVYNMYRQSRSPNVLSQTDLANYAAIAKVVSSQLSSTQNPAVGYFNRLR